MGVFAGEFAALGVSRVCLALFFTLLPEGSGTRDGGELDVMDSSNTSRITPEQFSSVDMRVATVVHAEHATRLRHPAHRLRLDLGPLGIRSASARITDRYSPEDLIGRQVIAVVNLPSKQVGAFVSECLVLGGDDERGQVVLLSPDSVLPAGTRVY